MRNYSYKNDFALHENETACRTHFHMKGFALRLVLKQRHKRTRKWPIVRHSVRCICGQRGSNSLNAWIQNGRQTTVIGL